MADLEATLTAFTERLAGMNEGTAEGEGEGGDGDPEDQVGIQDDETIKGGIADVFTVPGAVGDQLDHWVREPVTGGLESGGEAGGQLGS